MKVLVIKTPRHEEVLAFYQTLGLTFQKEKHGTGPEHFACEQNGVVFEIYPATKNETITILES